MARRRVTKSFDVSDRDTGWKKFLKLFKRAKHDAVVVGVIGNEASTTYDGTSVTVAQVANAHEFGTKHIPRRSFLRDGLQRKEAQVKRYIALQAKRVFLEKKMDQHKALTRIGLYVVGQLQKNIAEGGGFKPLHPETIRRKGSSKPLIDTGQLRRSIASEVRKVKR